MADTPLRVWLLSDGRPGHYKQSRGIVRALSRLRPVQTEWIDLKLRVGLFRVLLRAWFNHRGASPPLAMLNVFYRATLPAQPPRLIVSAGGRTSFANVWLARHFGVPNVFAGSLRGLRPDLFGAVLTLEPIAGADNNIVLTVPPSPVDADALAGRTVPGCDSAHPCWALLIGGDGAGYRYTDADWIALGRLLVQTADRYGIRWLLSTSPRTGRAAERLLRDAVPESCLAAAAWYGRDPADRVMDFLAAADRVLVTEDSMTMLTEAISAMKPVYSLRPAHAGPNARYRHVMQRFEGEGLVARFDIGELAARPETLEQVRCRPLKQPPLEQLARQLAGHLGL